MTRRLDRAFWVILMAVGVSTLGAAMGGDWSNVFATVADFVGGVGAGLLLAKRFPWKRL